MTDIHLERDEKLTILVQFAGTRYSSGEGVQGGFEIYRTSTLTANQNSAPYDVIVKNYKEEQGLFECVWRLTEPAGTRIKIQVMEFEGSDVTLSAGNGHDPSRGEPLLVMSPLLRPVLQAKEVLSFSAHMWVALKYTQLSGHLDRAEVIFITYDISGESIHSDRSRKEKTYLSRVSVLPKDMSLSSVQQKSLTLLNSYLHQSG